MYSIFLEKGGGRVPPTPPPKFAPDTVVFKFIENRCFPFLKRSFLKISPGGCCSWPLIGQFGSLDDLPQSYYKLQVMDIFSAVLLAEIKYSDWLGYF